MTQPSSSSEGEVTVSVSLGSGVVECGPSSLRLSDAEYETHSPYITPHTYIVLLGEGGSGKSTLAGQLLLLHGRVEEEQLQEAIDAANDRGRPDSYLSYIMDISEEERDQGRTLELAIERFECESKKFMIFDTPAIKINVSDMYLGMFAADIVVVVLSALSTDTHGSLMYIQMAVEKSVRKIVIAINHMDHPDVMWSESIYNSLEETIRPYAVHLVGDYNVRCIPTSGLQGQNISTRVDNTFCPWWKGPCLLEAINSLRVLLDNRYLFQGTRPDCQPTRMVIFSEVENHITLESNIVFGRLVSGILRVGDRVIIMPNEDEARVLRIYEDESFETQSDTIHVGINAYIELDELITNINGFSISTGYVLCSITNPIHTGTVFSAHLSFSGLSFNDYYSLANQGIHNFDHESRFFMLHMNGLAKECRIRHARILHLSGFRDPAEQLMAICMIEVLEEPICIEDVTQSLGSGYVEPDTYRPVTYRLGLVTLREGDGNMVANGMIYQTE